MCIPWFLLRDLENPGLVAFEKFRACLDVHLSGRVRQWTYTPVVPAGVSMPLRLFSCTILYSCLGHRDRVSRALVVKRSCEHPREVQLFCSSVVFGAGHLKVLSSGGRRALRVALSPCGRLVLAWPLGSFCCAFCSLFPS